jgi:hypothetical protein
LRECILQSSALELLEGAVLVGVLELVSVGVLIVFSVKRLLTLHNISTYLNNIMENTINLLSPKTKQTEQFNALDNKRLRMHSEVVFDTLIKRLKLLEVENEELKASLKSAQVRIAELTIQQENEEDNKREEDVVLAVEALRIPNVELGA